MTQVLKHPVSVIVITVLSLLLVLSFLGSIKKGSRNSQAVQETQEYVDSLEANITQLETSIAQDSTDFAREKRLRDELLLQKEGEQVIVLPEVTPSPPVTPTPTPATSHISEWWEAVQ